MRIPQTRQISSGTRWLSRALPLLVCLVSASGCSVMSVGTSDVDIGLKQRGNASWYGEELRGWETASGDDFNPDLLTAAHRTLPLGTVAKITNALTGKQVEVRINDRGPYIAGRILDLSQQAALQLGMMHRGIAPIHLEVVASHGKSPTPSLGEILRAGGAYGISVNNPQLAQPTPSPIPTLQRQTVWARTINWDIDRERRLRRIAQLLDTEYRPTGLSSGIFC